MKMTITTLTTVALLLSTGAAARGESQSISERPFMGVLIDAAPLPGLLNKHIGLPIGQGLRIQNVQKDSPADKAGLERDDLIIGFEGQDVHGYERFLDEIRKAGTGTEVSLQIIHLGVRKTVKLTLRPFEGEPDWKHPREPEAVQSWRPGRFFRLRPGDEDWKEMLRDNMPQDFDIDVKKFFKELRTYHHSNGEDYSVTIEGNPNDEDSTITVRVGDDKHTTTVKEIDKLPEKYRQAAEKAIENARKTSNRLKLDGDVDITWRRQPNWRGYFDKVNPRNYGPMPRFDRNGEIHDRIQKQMHEMRERLDVLEKRYREKLDGFLDERDEKEPEEKEESAPSNIEDGRKA